MIIIRGVYATLLIAGLILSAQVQAAQPGSKPIGPAAGTYYAGAKGGLMMPKRGGFDDAINIGGYGGYNLVGAGAPVKANLGGGTLAIEGDITLTASDGDFSTGGVSGDWEVTTIGAYAAYRFPLSATFYAKGKAGLVRSDVDFSVSGVSGSGAETDISLGAGVGFLLGNGSLEVEVARIKADDKFDFLSVGYIWNF